ncbi:excisionase [Rhodococcus sp. 06-235-1A]|uniref:DUF2637 domain-containing protein n=1 Tax=Rhodococcus sp. 06-235-1A TaxID=2022508 RepID=UPI000B9C6856|nr:DUF2637 domain-containing protein [Rhodococcus sp. 06-235-1A]OZD04838.1 excisionase [Rhodococcus sp. 06-235-1A]
MNKVLRATLVSAVVITTVIGIASFVLSFAALWDLATMAGVPRSLSWLWPVIVDGTILQATISVIALAQFEDQRSGRRFFWGVLITAALVSIGANAMHAFISDAGTLHPALSAVIATVAPVSLLAATHGLGILVRVPAELPKPIDIAEEEPAPEEAAPEEVAIAVPRDEPVAPAPEHPTPEIPALAPMKRTEPVRTEPEHIQPVRIEQPVPEPPVTPVRTVEPLDEVDRWILDEERVDDLYPVDAP